MTEWMYRKNLETNRTVTILERTTNNVKFGASVKKECELYKEQIPSETLALSFFNKLKLRTDVFTSVYSAIMSTLVVPTNFCEDTDILIVIKKNWSNFYLQLIQGFKIFFMMIAKKI